MEKDARCLWHQDNDVTSMGYVCFKVIDRFFLLKTWILSQALHANIYCLVLYFWQWSQFTRLLEWWLTGCGCLVRNISVWGEVFIKALRQWGHVGAFALQMYTNHIEFQLTKISIPQLLIYGMFCSSNSWNEWIFEKADQPKRQVLLGVFCIMSCATNFLHIAGNLRMKAEGGCR